MFQARLLKLGYMIFQPPQPQKKIPGTKARFFVNVRTGPLGSLLALGTRTARAMGTKGQMAVQL